MSRKALGIGLIVVVSIATGFALGSFTQSVGAAAAVEEVTPFNEVAFASKVVGAWESRNAEMIGATMSDLYNEIGLSKQEALVQTEAMLGQYEDVQVRYRVLDFKQFPGTKLGSAKAVLEMLAKKPGQKDLVPVIQTMGYASLIFEDGDWKVYGTQEVASEIMDSSSFEFESVSTDWWPDWGTQWTPEELQKLRSGVR